MTAKEAFELLNSTMQNEAEDYVFDNIVEPAVIAHLDKEFEDYDWEELWKEAVYHWNCRDSYRDWVEEVKSNWDAEMTVKDDSYCDEEWLQEAMKYANEKEERDYEYSDCRGGWRMFDEDNIKEDYYEYFIPENLKKLQEQYREFEKSWNQN